MAPRLVLVLNAGKAKKPKPNAHRLISNAGKAKPKPKAPRLVPNAGKAKPKPKAQFVIS